MLLDPFYLIVDNSQAITKLVPLGVKLVQLRIKNKTEYEIKQQIIEASEICKTYNCQLIINDYWELAYELGCDFVHLGQEDLAAVNIKSLAKTNMKIGISTHTHDELNTALSTINKGVNLAYIALGPIYETRLKKMSFAPQGLDRIAEWKKLIVPIPLVAIGGLSIERAKLCLQKGADSTAVVTDISLNENPVQRTLEWINEISTRKTI